MQRVVAPEWLDALPPGDERAAASRRDLRRVNRLIGSAAILAGALVRGVAAPPRVIADLGAGDGHVALGLARRLAPRWPGARLVLVDRAPAVAPATLAAIGATGWRVESVAADAAEWCRAPDGGADVVVANLFLHHFAGEALAALLGAIAARATLFAACDPRRGQVALAASRLLGLIGCNEVTRHDAVVSVRAGFAGRELSALWPRDGAWAVEERAAGWSSHLFVVRRLARGGGAG